MLALDGSEESEKAADAAVEIAGRFGSDVVVLNVADLYYHGAAVWTPGRSAELEAFLSRVVDAI